MKLYRVTIRTEDGRSGGFEWFTAKDPAEKRVRWLLRKVPKVKHSVEAIEITYTKQGLIAAFNTYAGHPDNG